jgi:hypothetical protein
MTTKKDILKKIFPGLDARTHDHLARLLPDLEHDRALHAIAAADPSSIDVAMRRGAQGVVLRRLYAALTGDRPDPAVSTELRDIAQRGDAPTAVTRMLHAEGSGGATAVTAAVDDLAAQGAATTAVAEALNSNSSSGASPPAEPPVTPGPSGSGDAPRKDSSMALTFTFDMRNIPTDLASTPALQTAYINGVTNILKLRGIDTTDTVFVAAVIGGLLRQGQFDPSSASMPQFVGKICDDLLQQQTAPAGATPPTFNGLAVYHAISDTLLANAQGGANGSGSRVGSNGASGVSVSYQLFSYVGEQVLQTISRVPIGDPNFGARVQSAVLAYASGSVGYEDLELPSLETATDTEIVPENIQACGMMYAAYQLELAKLLPVLDLVSDLYDDGLIPIAFDAAGQALDDYRFTDYERISAAKRATYFARVFGMKGADVPKTVVPNAQFETLMLRFTSTVAEYERIRDLAQTWGQTGGGPGTTRPGAITSEHVRKAGRELAANLSLYGWASAHTVARRLNGHIKQALAILGLTQVQQAFGASNVWQVIERVSQQELKTTPNIVKYRTMADAGKKVLDVVARNPDIWRSATYDVFDGLLGASNPDGGDKTILLQNARYWLTVNGVTDTTLDQMSQNVEMANVPSLPAMGGTSAADGAMNQLKTMIQAGQTPSMDQLQRMIMN